MDDENIQNKYKLNPDKLAAWKSASRVERAPRKKKDGGDEPTPPTP